MSAVGPAISLRGVVKRFGPITAVAGLDLEVPMGICLGLLGPNGAGKSTTMRMLTAQSIPDEGEIEVLGYKLPGESKQARAECGVVPQLDNLDVNSIVQPDGQKLVRQAVRRLKSEGTPVERGQVVAALSFGSWRGLFGPTYERLWRQQLSHAFPGAGTRKHMSVPLTKLNQFRNRLAHHDSILHVNVAGRLDQMVQIATYSDPRAGAWLKRSSRMLEVSTGRP